MAQDNLRSNSTAKSLAIGQSGAGAGFAGLFGCACFFALGAVLYVTENYFASLFCVSIALLFYVAGRDIQKLFLSSFTIFFTRRHLISKASCLEETLHALTESLEKAGTSGVGVKKITLPANPLSLEIQKLMAEDKGFDSLEYAVHSYYIECHELYDFSSANLDFVAVSMPIFGLIGTVIGLMSMFDNLGGDITIDTLSPQLAMALKTTLYGALFSAVYKIIGSRFERRIRTLDYDYETICRGLQVLLENKVKIEIA